jgi:DNA-directed RNA polymerase specialized sigma24 family protein
MANEFDLDVTFEESEPNLSSLSASELKEEVAKLPDSLRPVAEGLLLENRTMSDVSQALGIRQAELVTRLHRAKKIIASAKGL